MICVCQAQLQPHDPLPGVCAPAKGSGERYADSTADGRHESLLWEGCPAEGLPAGFPGGQIVGSKGAAE